LKHGNYKLNVVYLSVEGLSFAVALTKVVNKLNTFHFRLIDQVLILHLHANELMLNFCGILICKVDLSQILVVIFLQLITNLCYLLLLLGQLLDLNTSDISLEVECSPLRVDHALHLLIFKI